MKAFNAAQDEMIDHALEDNSRAWFAKPGIGKTRAALEVMAATDGPKLVVAPDLVCSDVWPNEIEKWGYEFSHRYLHGKNKHLDDLPEISLINYHGLPWLADQLKRRECPFTQIIYDEVSKMKHPGSSRFKRWRSHMPKFQHRLGMTGSPLGNKLADLWGECFCCDLGQSLGHSKERFMFRYFVQYDRNQWRPTFGAKEAIFEQLHPMARAWNLDAIDMPPLMHNVIPIHMPEAARKWYNELDREGTIEELDFVADNPLVAMGKKRQIAAGAMYDPEGHVVKMHDQKKAKLRDLIEEQQGDPIIVVYEFDHDLTAILEAAKGCSIGMLNGKTTGTEGAETLKAWRDGALEILAFHPLSASYGLNLQSVSSTIVFYTCPWSLELVEQATRRLWRQGQERTVVAHYLAVRGTIDEDVLLAVDVKEDDQDELFEALA